MPDTAVAEPTTTAAEPEATEVVEETLPESELVETTDNGDADAQTDSEATEGEEDAAPKTLTIEEHEKVLKAERAKLEESYRQKTENAQKAAQTAANAEAYRANVTKAQRDQAGAIFNEFNAGIASVIKARDNGEEVGVNPDWLANIAVRQADAAFWSQDSAIASFFDARTAQTNPGGRKPPELAADLENALPLHATDPNRPAQVLSARLAIMEASVREQLTPKLREEIEAEVRAELGAAGKTAAMKENDAARAGQPKPTGVGTAPNNNNLTLARLKTMTTKQILELTSTPAGQKAHDRALSGG